MIPRITAIQSMVRLFFEDGTIAVVTVRPGQLPVDALQSEVPVEPALVHTALAEQLKAVQDHIEQQSPAEIYKYAKKTARPQLQLPIPQATIPPSEIPEDATNVGSSSEDPGHGPAAASGQ